MLFSRHVVTAFEKDVCRRPGMADITKNNVQSTGADAVLTKSSGCPQPLKRIFFFFLTLRLHFRQDIQREPARGWYVLPSAQWETQGLFSRDEQPKCLMCQSRGKKKQPEKKSLFQSGRWSRIGLWRQTEDQTGRGEAETFEDWHITDWQNMLASWLASA